MVILVKKINLSNSHYQLGVCRRLLSVSLNYTLYGCTYYLNLGYTKWKACWQYVLVISQYVR